MTIRIDGTNTAANPGITGSDTDTGLQFGTNEIKVVTNGSEKATFGSTGNFVLDGGSDVRIELGSNGTTATNDRNHIRGDGDNIKFNTCADGLFIFEQNGTEELRILSGGGLTFNGDTAAANALDDYEEGTWQPTVTTGTVNYAFARYTKIGRQVTIAARISAFSNRTSTAAVVVGNLPYATGASNPQAAGSAFFRYVNNQFTVVYIDNTDLLFYRGGSGGFDSMQHQDITDSTCEIYFFATYFIA